MTSNKKQLIQMCRTLYQNGMLAACDGNLSFRREEDGLIWVTPSAVPKYRVEEDQLVLIDLEGRVIEAKEGFKPSSETKMHLHIYRHCEKAKAVVHAHPRMALALSIARPDWKELPADAMSEVLIATGGIPFVPYARPGTTTMGDVLSPFLPTHRALILSRHGGLTWGEDLDEAYRGMDRLEHAAHVIYLAESLGGVTRLAPEEIVALKNIRKNVGEKLL